MDASLVKRCFESKSICTVWIDADDTLWHDRVHFKRLRDSLLCEASELGFSREATLAAFRTVAQQAAPGEQGFAGSVIRTAEKLAITDRRLNRIKQAVELFLTHPVNVFEFARESLYLLRPLRPMLVTKGSRPEQMRKLDLSGLGSCFDEVHVLAQKNPRTFRDLLRIHLLRGPEVVAIGNSVREDVIPAIDNGAFAVWLNHGDNSHGRDGIVPHTAIEIENWQILYGALSTMDGRHSVKHFSE